MMLFHTFRQIAVMNLKFNLTFFLQIKLWFLLKVFFLNFDRLNGFN